MRPQRFKILTGLKVFVIIQENTSKIENEFRCAYRMTQRQKKTSKISAFL